MIARGPYLNIWGNPTIAEDVRVGAYTEIGDDVTIEAGVVIGAMCFIPPKVRIRAGAWIGPRVTFTNDKYPPSEMIETIVGEGARVGAGSVILPGITLGPGCMVGAGSVVTKSVPPGVTVVGNPARPLVAKDTVKGKLDEILEHAKETEAMLLNRWGGEGGR